MNDLQNRINQSALIVKKYNLGDKLFFTSNFESVNQSNLDVAWTLAERKIQNRDIIKDASFLTIAETNLVKTKTDAFDNNSYKLYEKLTSKFDVKELRIHDENIERKVRHILALRFLKNNSDEVNEIIRNQKKSLKSRVIRFLTKIKYGLISFGVIFIFSASRIIDGLTLPENLLNEYLHEEYPSIKTSKIDVDILTNYLHEDSKYKFNGAICKDGWTSHSQGRGTCSHHRGVNYYFYKGEYDKSIEQCHEEAKNKLENLRLKAIEKSWRD